MRRLQTGFVRSYALSDVRRRCVLARRDLLMRAVWMTDVLSLLTVDGGVPAPSLALAVGRRAGRGRAARQVGRAGVSLVVLVLAVARLVALRPGRRPFQFTESHSWIPAFGISYALGVDGIALVLIALTAVLVPLRDPRLVARRRRRGEPAAPRRRPHAGFFALILVVEAMVLGLFAATDVFLFYVFFEAMLIPMYFLIGGFGRPAADERHAASYAREVPALQPARRPDHARRGDRPVRGHAGRARHLRPRSPTRAPTASWTGDPRREKWLFLGFFFAFAVKAPLWPLHTWLPDADGGVHPPVAVLITASSTRSAPSAMLRFCLELFPEAVASRSTPAIIVLAVISIIYGALLAIGQTDIKRLIAYTSISHFGFIILGIFAMTSQGQSGATLYMVNHGISTAALFLVAGFLISRRGSRLSPTTAACRRSPRCSPAPSWSPVSRRFAARPRAVRQRVPGPGRHVRALPGGGDLRHHRHRPRRALRAVCSTSGR